MENRYELPKPLGFVLPRLTCAQRDTITLTGEQINGQTIITGTGTTTINLPPTPFIGNSNTISILGSSTINAPLLFTNNPNIELSGHYISPIKFTLWPSNEGIDYTAENYYYESENNSAIITEQTIRDFEKNKQYTYNGRKKLLFLL